MGYDPLRRLVDGYQKGALRSAELSKRRAQLRGETEASSQDHSPNRYHRGARDHQARDPSVNEFRFDTIGCSRCRRCFDPTSWVDASFLVI